MAPLSCILTLAPFSCFKTMPKGFCIHSSHFASHSLSLSPSPPFTPPTSLQLSDLSRSRRRKESGEGWEGGISERKLVRRNQTGSLSWERRTSVGREEQGGLVGMIENQGWGLSEWIKNKGILLTPCKKKHFQKAEFIMIFFKNSSVHYMFQTIGHLWKLHVLVNCTATQTLCSSFAENKSCLTTRLWKCAFCDVSEPWCLSKVRDSHLRIPDMLIPPFPLKPPCFCLLPNAWKVQQSWRKSLNMLSSTVFCLFFFRSLEI